MRNLILSPLILDITEYILPLNPTQVFGNQNDNALEIGFGEGDFLIELARKKTDWNFIGIEIKRKRLVKAIKKAERSQLKNIRFLLMDAQIAISEVFSKDSFSEVYINFPDPWPKERHKKHRFINIPFLRRLSLIMKPGSILEIVSDHKEYIDYILEAIQEAKTFRAEFEYPHYITVTPSDRPKTRYELEFRKEGREIYYLRFINEKKEDKINETHCNNSATDAS